MTTPLEALELAKRLRVIEELFARQGSITDDAYARTVAAAAAFLEHPVNTGQGVTEEEVERAFQAYLKSSESETQEELIRPWAVPALRAALAAARTPLASVEGGPPTVEEDIFAQSGRSSAEPVAWQWRQFHSGKWWDWNPCYDEARRLDRSDYWRDIARQLPNEVEVRPLYLSLPVGPQEAVAVKAALDEFEGYDKHGGVDDTLTAARLLAKAVRSALSSSGIDLGGEVERLTRELRDYQARVIPAETEVVRLEAALHDLQTRLEKIALPHVAFPETSVDGYASMAVVTAREALASLSTNAVREGDDA